MIIKGKLQAFIISLFLLGSVFIANADLNGQIQEAMETVTVLSEIHGTPEGEGSTIATLHTLLKQSENGNPFSMMLLAQQFLGEFEAYNGGIP